MAVDLVIKNGSIIQHEPVRAAVAIDNGKVVAIGTEAAMPPAAEELDARGQYVLPGFIDAHVHFRTPGMEYKEDVRSGSMAAVFGGVTTVLDMPNTIPITDSADAIRLREAIIRRDSFVDTMLVGVLTPHNGNGIEAMADAGVVGFKVYLGESVGEISTPTTGQLFEYLSQAAELGLRVAFHAEAGEVLDWYLNKVRSAERTDIAAFAESRPIVAELDAINRACGIASATGAMVHILHLSSALGLDVVREWRNRGLDVTCETGPQYALLSVADLVRLGPIARSNPPLRARSDAAALFEGLADGTINMLATDHAPHTEEEKVGRGTWDALSGFVGVETMAQLMLSEGVNKGRMSLQRFVHMTSEGPAKVWGVWPRKGSIRIGSDADLTLVDLDREWTVDEEALHSKHPVSPWTGWSGRGAPRSTVVGGRVVVREGALEARAPRGRLVRPESATDHGSGR